MTLDDPLEFWQTYAPALLIVAFLALLFAHLALRRYVLLLIAEIREARTRCPRDKLDLFGEWEGRCVRHDLHHPKDCKTNRSDDEGPKR